MLPRALVVHTVPGAYILQERYADYAGNVIVNIVL